jgi:superfamily II DNA/RNA helicase
MLDMGFKPQVDRIVRRLPRNRQTMFFSATLDGAVGELAREYTNSPSRFTADRGAIEDGEITHRFVAVAHDTKVESLVEHIRAADGKTLVFVRTKRGADRLARKLGGHDVRALAMHGDLSQGQRQRALARFERGDVAVLVATDVAARGLDIEHIAHVVNYDPPMEHKEYVHRTGRTGRAGREEAVTSCFQTNRPTRAASRTVSGTPAVRGRRSSLLAIAPRLHESQGSRSSGRLALGVVRSCGVRSHAPLPRTG